MTGKDLLFTTNKDHEDESLPMNRTEKGESSSSSTTENGGEPFPVIVESASDSIVQSNSNNKQRPEQPTQTRFNFYIPQDPENSSSTSRRFHFYNAAEVQAEEESAAVLPVDPPSSLQSEPQRQQQQDDNKRTHRPSRSSHSHHVVSSATIPKGALPHHSHDEQHGKKRTTTTSYSSVDSSEILKSLQETERQARAAALGGGNRRSSSSHSRSSAGAASIQSSRGGGHRSTTSSSSILPVATASSKALRGGKNTAINASRCSSKPASASSSTAGGAQRLSVSGQTEPKANANPYRDAIQEALVMLQRNKRRTTTSASSSMERRRQRAAAADVDDDADDLILQLRREQSNTTVGTTSASGGASVTLSSSSSSSSLMLPQQQQDSCETRQRSTTSKTTTKLTEWTPPLPGVVENNTAEELIRMRSESDDFTEPHLQQQSPTHYYDNNNTEDQSSVDSAHVEQVLLAILERADNNSGSASASSSLSNINHATELDALSAAMDSLLQPSFEDHGTAAAPAAETGPTPTAATTLRSRRPNRREIEQHALDVSLADTTTTMTTTKSNPSADNDLLEVMEEKSPTPPVTAGNASSPSVVEELLQDDVALSEVDDDNDGNESQQHAALSADYCTPTSSTDELALNESIEVIECASSTEGMVAAAATTTTALETSDAHADVAASTSASAASTYTSESESSRSSSSSTFFEGSTSTDESDEYEEDEDEVDYRETSVDESTMAHLLGKRPKRRDDDEHSDDEDDECDEKDRSADENTLINVLGPLSRRAGGTTGVVLEASSEDVQSQPAASTDDATAPLSPASIYETLSSAVRDAESFMTYVTSGGYPNIKDKYFTGDDDDETAVAGKSTVGDEIDADAHELMRSLCAHLLPYGVDKSTQSPKLERVPIWDESNPDEAGYRIIRLSKRQLCAVESEFDKMVKSVKRRSERDLNGGLVKAETRNDWNGVPDDDFTRDLEEAEKLLDQEEKRREDAERADPPEQLDDGSRRSSSSGSESSDSSTMSDTGEGTTSPIMSETDDDTMLTSHPDFPGVKTTGRGEIGDLEYFHLPIIYKSNVTGFEPTKDLYLEPGNVVAGQYLVENELGSAAFSTAYRCVDLSSETRTEKGQQVQEEVCLKVIKNTKDFFDQSLDEIKILELLRQTGKCHENHILEMKTFFYHREHLIIVTELLRQNLFEFGKFITESDEEEYFTRTRLCFITRQVLTALNFIHRMGLVHSDVKPENILLSSYSRAQVRLIDFGSSCYLTDRQSSYIQSRSYRAPEVVLGLPYDGKIDIWSLGCVVAEMYTGEVTFQNDSIVSMLSRIEAICGPFPRYMIAQGRQSNRFFTKSGLLFEHVDSENGEGPTSDRKSDRSLLDVFQPKRTTLAARLGMPDIESEDEAHFVDFCSKLLAVDPDSRPTAAEALKHPWIVSGQCLTEEDIKYPSK